MQNAMRHFLVKLILSGMTVESLLSCSAGSRSESVSQVKIMGGIPANPDEFPFMVSLKMKRVLTKGGAPSKRPPFHICGATLITPTKLLTAAHCVLSFREDSVHDCSSAEDARDPGVPENGPNELYAYIGEYSQATNDEQEVEIHRIFSEDIAIHPDYRSCRKGNYDLAVLTLRQASTHQTLPLFTADDQDFRSGVDTFEVLGWGMNRPADDKTPWSELFPAVLHKASVPFVSRKSCLEHYERLGIPGIIPSSVICAGDFASAEKRDACTLDSGGPLLYHDPMEEAGTQQLGIVSAGKGCGLHPGVYTFIPAFVDWINP